MRTSGHTSQIDKMRAMRTILTVSRYAIGEEEWGYWSPLCQVPLMYYSFIDEYERDKNFAINLPVGEMEESVQRERIEKARRMIYQRCMGLLETYTVPSSDRPAYYKSGMFPHRGITPFAPVASQRATTPTTSRTRDYIGDEDEGISDAENSSSWSEFEASISGEENDEYFHAHTMYNDDGTFNHRFKYQPRVRCIHRSVHEFLAQPRIEELARLDARNFDEADFHFQAVIACLKMFRPSVYFTRERLLVFCESLVRMKHCSSLTMEGTRLAALLQQVLQVVQYHHLKPGLLFIGPLNWSMRDSVFSQCHVYLPTDAALYLVLQRCNGTQYTVGDELSRQICTEEGIIHYSDLVLDNYLSGIVNIYDVRGFQNTIKRYCLSVFENLSRLFEAGLSANTKSIHSWSNHPVGKCWYLWLVHSLSCRDPENIFERFIRLFLRYGAECNVWFRYRTGVFSMWWPGRDRSLSVVWTESVLAETTPWFRSESKIGIFMASRTEESGIVSLRDILPQMYPHCGAELQRLADQNQGVNPPPAEDVWIEETEDEGRSVHSTSLASS